jgi:hypothetical protein
MGNRQLTIAHYQLPIYKTNGIVLFLSNDSVFFMEKRVKY